MFGSLLLLLLLQVEPRLTVEFESTDVGRVVEVLETYSGAKIEVAPLYAGRQISLKVDNLGLTEILGVVARKLGGETTATGKDRFRIAPGWQHSILGKLEKQKVHGLLMEDVELGQALRLFRSQCEVDVHSTIDAKKKIQLEADDVTYRALLDAIAKAAGGEWELRYGVAYLAAEGELARMPLLPPEIGKDPVLPLHLENRSLEESLRFLQAASKRKFEWPETLLKRSVSVRAKSVTLSQALALVLYPAGLTAGEREGTIVVSKRK